VLNSYPHEGTALELEGLVGHGKRLLNSIKRVELNVGNSFASAASRIAVYPNISDLAAIRLAEEVPNIALFGFEWQAIHKDGMILPVCLLHLLLYLNIAVYVLL
jgi:hypothetical protein